MPQRRCLRIGPAPNHNRPGRTLLSGEPGQSARAAHPVVGEVANLLADLGHRRSQRVIVPRLESHHARRLGRAKADREHRPQHDRHLAENIPDKTLTQNAINAIHRPDRLDPPLDHGEQRALVTFVGRVIPLHQPHVGSRAADLLALGLAQRGEHCDAPDLLCGDHDSQPPLAPAPVVWFMER